MIGRTDDETGAIIIIPLAHANTHDGRMYEVSYKTPDGSPLADNDNLDFLFRVGKWHCHFSEGPIAANPIETVFYENPIITGVGTQLSVVSLNRERNIAPESTAYRSPTVSSVGNILRNNLEVWGLANLTRAFTETSWLLKKDTDYLFRIINRSGSAQDVAMVMQWFENGN